MTNSENPEQGNLESEAKTDLNTDVILVVKGAGLHEPDDTLNQFLQGFWPAVLKLDSNATINQIHDKSVFEGYKSTPHTDKEHAHVTEINVTIPNANDESSQRRIWIKEAYWEDELKPPGAFRALLDEWRMASYAMRRELTNFFRTRYLFLEYLVNPPVNQSPSKPARYVRAKYDAVRDFASQSLSKPVGYVRELRKRLSKFGEFTSIYLSYTVVYIIFFVLFINGYRYALGLPNYKQTFDTFEHFVRVLVWLAATTGAQMLLPAAILALPPTMRIYWRAVSKKERLPGLPHLMLVLLIITFLLIPNTYIVLFIALSIPVVLIVISRGLYWDRRAHDNTDKDYVHVYLSHPDDGPDVEQKGNTIRVNTEWFFPFLFYYRLLVVLGLPIAMILLTVTRVLKLFKPLAEVASKLENLFSLFLSRGLGDVSAYAMDPAQAHRIRSVIENEIRFFHNQACVDRIHIFAHSQGTPITFETLFHHLPDEYRQRISSYVTIGSVLSYYYQTAPVLDRVSTPSRFRKRAYPKFADDFMWFNCWNLADQITEFYGLDEYVHDPVSAADTSTSNPVNIKTRARGHSDYWTNVDEVHLPLAKRVLGLDPQDAQWRPKANPKGMRFHTRVNLTSIALVGLLYSGALLYFYTTWIPNSFYPPLYQRLLTDLYATLSGSENGLIQFFFSLWSDPAKLEGLKAVWNFAAANLSTILLAAFVLYSMRHLIGAITMLRQVSRARSHRSTVAGTNR